MFAAIVTAGLYVPLSIAHRLFGELADLSYDAFGALCAYIDGDEWVDDDDDDDDDGGWSPYRVA